MCRETFVIQDGRSAHCMSAKVTFSCSATTIASSMKLAVGVPARITKYPCFWSVSVACADMVPIKLT